MSYYASIEQESYSETWAACSHVDDINGETDESGQTNEINFD